jgi:hypothetical protein
MLTFCKHLLPLPDKRKCIKEVCESRQQVQEFGVHFSAIGGERF